MCMLRDHALNERELGGQKKRSKEREMWKEEGQKTRVKEQELKKRGGMGCTLEKLKERAERRD